MEKDKNSSDVLLKIVAALMIVNGLFAVLLGLPLLLILVGIVPVLIGGASIYFGTQVWAMKKSAYNGAVVIVGISLVFSLFLRDYLGALLPALELCLLYNSKDKFVN